MTEYRAIGPPGELAFATKLPGAHRSRGVSPGHDILIHRHGFLCGTPQIQIGWAFQAIPRAGIFGGRGICLAARKRPGHLLAGTLPAELVLRDLASR